MFHQAAYQDASGRTLRSEDMTRDGFSLLVMGYTGPKAMEFKVRYIEQFNAMEAELSKQQKQPQVPQSYAEALRAAADAEEKRQIAQQEATAQRGRRRGVGH